MLYDGCYPTVSARSASLHVAIPRLAAISAALGPGNAPLRLATCANSTGGVEGWVEQAWSGVFAYLATVAGGSEPCVRWAGRSEENPTLTKRLHKHVRSSMKSKESDYGHARSKS